MKQITNLILYRNNYDNYNATYTEQIFNLYVLQFFLQDAAIRNCFYEKKRTVYSMCIYILFCSLFKQFKQKATDEHFIYINIYERASLLH